MDDVIIFNSVDYFYRKNNNFHLHLDFKANSGEMIGIIGPNGSGKSTLLELTFGSIKPRSGNIRVTGKNPIILSPARRAQTMAYLVQKQLAPYSSSVFEIILSGRRPYKKLGDYSDEDETIALSSAELLNIESWLNRKGSELSGGEYQRVLLSRTITQRTPIILCDEPASSLDVRYQHETLQILKNLTKTRNICVMTSIHDLSIAIRYCDRILLLDKGNICFNGIPSELDEKLLSSVYQIPIVKVPHGKCTLFTVE